MSDSQGLVLSLMFVFIKSLIKILNKLECKHQSHRQCTTKLEVEVVILPNLSDLSNLK